MLTAWMLAVMLSGPPVADRSTQAVVPVQQMATRRAGAAASSSVSRSKTTGTLSRSDRRDLLEAAYRQAMQSSAQRKRPDYACVVPRLTRLVGELKRQRSVAPTRTDTMRRRLTVRLTQIQRILVRKIRRELRRKPARTIHTRGRWQTSSQRDDMKLAGPGDIAGARALIDLIQTVIAPNTWDINGGKGRINYYRPLQVLVIRQTGEVHHQIGGTLRQLGR